MDKIDIDLGDGHALEFSCWAPDDLPGNRELYEIPEGQPMPHVEKWGAMIRHSTPDGKPCMAHITFDGEWQRRAHDRYAERCKREGREPRPYVAWTVSSWEPLTCSPSLLCLAQGCGDHGFIENGKWRRA